MRLISSVWFEILSEVFVNLGSGWFGLVLYEVQFNADPAILITRVALGIMSLVIAKLFREEVRQR